MVDSDMKFNLIVLAWVYFVYWMKYDKIILIATAAFVYHTCWSVESCLKKYHKYFFISWYYGLQHLIIQISSFLFVCLNIYWNITIHCLPFYWWFLFFSQVDNNFFLAVVPITSFDSDTLLNTFPKANREGVVQIRDDLKKQISK